MIKPDALNLSILPSLPIEQRKALPEISGIYFAIDSLGLNAESNDENNQTTLEQINQVQP